MTLTLTPDTSTATIDVTFDDAAEDIVTITRSIEGGAETVVRGAAAAETSGGVLFVRDDEAPFGQPLIYVAYDEAGDQLELAATRLDVTQPWLKVPGQPSLSHRVRIGDHDRTDAYSTPQGLFRPVGSPYPIVVSGTTSARATQVTLITLSAAEAVALLRALQAAPTILLETPYGHALTRGYFAVSGFSRKQHDRHGGEASIWTLPLTEVDVPAGGTAAGVTWATVVDTYPTWQDLVDEHSTWLELLQAH